MGKLILTSYKIMHVFLWMLYSESRRGATEVASEGTKANALDKNTMSNLLKRNVQR